MVIALLQGISFGMAPLLGIGPFKIFVLSQSLQRGWRNALHLALVPLVADVPVILLMWMVLQQLPASVVNLLRIVGGVFYLYLAYHIVVNVQKEIRREDLRNTPQRSFLQAIAAVWVTPAVYVNWSTIGVPAMLLYAEQSAGRVVGFLLGFYLLWVGGLALQIYLVGKAGDLNPNANKALIYLAVSLLVWFGLYQLWIGGSTIFGA